MRIINIKNNPAKTVKGIRYIKQAKRTVGWCKTALALYMYSSSRSCLPEYLKADRKVPL